MLSKIKKSNKGFTLIELLVVIAIIAILATVVFVALDPATRFADSRNSRRWNDVNSILTAIHQCVVDNDGILATCGLTADAITYTLGTPTAGTVLNLSVELAPYLLEMPMDPRGGTAANTGYTITVNANNIVTIAAANPENLATISVSR